MDFCDSPTCAARLKALDRACSMIDSFGFRSDDYGGTDDLTSCIKALGEERDRLRAEKEAAAAEIERLRSEISRADYATRRAVERAESAEADLAAARERADLPKRPPYFASEESGWYWYDTEYPDEGACGPWPSEDDARANARDEGGYDDEGDDFAVIYLMTEGDAEKCRSDALEQRCTALAAENAELRAAFLWTISLYDLSWEREDDDTRLERFLARYRAVKRITG